MNIFIKTTKSGKNRLITLQHNIFRSCFYYHIKRLCGYFVIAASAKMTAEEALALYRSRDASSRIVFAQSAQ